MSVKIGFIGQGWIGKNYADDFEGRGYHVVRYALEEPYCHNKEQLADCSIIFIAVPTPTTPKGFDLSVVEIALSLVPAGSIAVIKSTLLPGSTHSLQEMFKELFVLHSPEFLREATAAHDAAHPDRNLIGIPVDTEEFKKKAAEVLAVLPDAPYDKVMSANAAELVKYAGNCYLYTKVVFMNLLYDLAEKEEISWEILREALVKDPRIGESHTMPVHYSGHVSERDGAQRGAGGHCFIKDFEAFRSLYAELHDEKGDQVLTALVTKNNELLRTSGKDLDLLAGVYGE